MKSFPRTYYIDCQQFIFFQSLCCLLNLKHWSAWKSVHIPGLLNNSHLSWAHRKIAVWAFHFIPISYSQHIYLYIYAFAKAVTSHGISSPSFPIQNLNRPLRHIQTYQEVATTINNCAFKGLCALSKGNVSLCLPELITVGWKQYFYTSDHTEMSL